MDTLKEVHFVLLMMANSHVCCLISHIIYNFWSHHIQLACIQTAQIDNDCMEIQLSISFKEFNNSGK